MIVLVPYWCRCGGTQGLRLESADFLLGPVGSLLCVWSADCSELAVHVLPYAQSHRTRVVVFPIEMFSTAKIAHHGVIVQCMATCMCGGLKTNPEVGQKSTGSAHLFVVIFRTLLPKGHWTASEVFVAIDLAGVFG